MRKKNQIFLSGEVKTAKHDLVYSFRRLSNVHSGQAKDVVFYPVYHSRACKTRTSKWTSRTSADQTSNVTSQNWVGTVKKSTLYKVALHASASDVFPLCIREALPESKKVNSVER